MKQFEYIKVDKPKANLFDLSHEKKLTMDAGDLVPILLQEVIPGDNFKIHTESLIRMQPMLAPLMHRVNVYVHYFAVPYRIIWEDFEKFITGQQEEGTPYNHPKFTGTATQFAAMCGIGSVADYFGLPVINYVEAPQNDEMPAISQLPFRAYAQIYNDYYRPQFLEEPITVDKSSADASVYQNQPYTDCMLMRKRCWEKDYFTSALPNEQYGQAVTLPLGNTAPFNNLSTHMQNVAGGNPTAGYPLTSAANGGITINGVPAWVDGYTDLSAATGSTVNQLRRAYAIQRWFEKIARGGLRYVEQILMQFGVRSKDARLDRSEYIGGGKLPIVIGEVLQTSQSGTTPQGNMAGHGITSGIPDFINYYATEHCFIIGIMSILPRTAYSQGIPKIFSKFDAFDYYFPDFAHLGEQPVLNQELYLGDENSGNDGVFGYQPRYSEYRYQNDSIHGDFRTSMDFWHMGRDFGSTPVLNASFCQATPTKRIFPVPSADRHYIVQLYNNIRAIRLISKFGTPV